jgi:hypothetical protein
LSKRQWTRCAYLLRKPRGLQTPTVPVMRRSRSRRIVACCLPLANTHRASAQHKTRADEEETHHEHHEERGKFATITSRLWLLCCSSSNRPCFKPSLPTTGAGLGWTGVKFAQSTSGLFHFRREVFAQQLKSRVGLALAKATDLRITLNLNGAPIISKSHTHSSHSQTSRLVTSSLFLGVPVPRPTQCMRDV